MAKISFILTQNSELFAILSILLIVGLFLYFLFHMKQFSIDSKYVISLVCIYSVISLWKLGSFEVPSTIWQTSHTSQEIIFEIQEDKPIQQITFLAAESESGQSGFYIGAKDVQILGSNDAKEFTPISTLSADSYYQYSFIAGNWHYKYIKLIFVNSYEALAEIGFYNDSTQRFLDVTIKEDAYANTNYPASLLIDEQDKLISYPTYYDQTYFDEIYHVRNAQEIAEGKYMYATVHPLFGTNIIALFIHLFGFSPFVYRLPGALFGILMIPLLYAISKLLLKNSHFAFLTTFIFTFDFMHITTSRIATLEPFSIFFIMAMFYYMLKYIQSDYLKTSLKKKLFYLFMSGFTMSLAISIKWNACYSAIGLAILFFYHLYQEYKAYQSYTESENKKIFENHTVSIVMLCFVFFIFMPIIIYFLMYLPDRVWHDGYSISNIISHTQGMFSYHSTLNATHPFSSHWYDWLFDIRPIWYSFKEDANGLSHTIACFSHPLFTWVGFGSILYTTYQAIKKKDFSAFFIVVGYITAILPWIIFVSRIVFAYHYYPIAIFNALAIGYTFYMLFIKEKISKKTIIIFLIIYLLIFILYLPITCGFGTSEVYRNILKILGSWIF